MSVCNCSFNELADDGNFPKESLLPGREPKEDIKEGGLAIYKNAFSQDRLRDSRQKHMLTIK